MLYSFGPFRLDPEERRLYRDGKPLALRPKTFDLLVLLIENPEHLLCREALIEAIWPQSVVMEHGLTVSIGELRKALGDDEKPPRYIETVPRSGYRFIAPVTVEKAETASSRPGRRGLWLGLGAAGVVALCIVAGLFAAHLLGGAPAAKQTTASIAVLPFKNLSADSANAYFSTGIQNLIVAKLADIGSLKVIAPISTAKYRSHPSNLETIGRQLGVTTILEGSVQKAGRQVLVNVQLINAKTDAHIWAQTYTRRLGNIFDIEGEVAREVAGALKAKLSATESARLRAVPTTNPVAYNDFLRAEYFTNHGTTNYDTASLKQALPLYRQAVAKDPDFALARARLSYTQSLLAFFGGGGKNVKHLQAAARTQAERALAIDPNLPQAYVAIGYSDYYGEGDYAGALRAFGSALALRPNDAGALAARGYVLRRQGRFNASIAALKQALAHDPHNTSLVYELGATHMLVSHYAAAERLFRRALALNPDNVQAKLAYSMALLLDHGDIPGALSTAAGDNPLLRWQRVYLLTLQRHYERALTLLDAIPDTPANFGNLNGSKALQQANLYRLMGDSARARPLYEKALPKARAELTNQTGIILAFTWGHVASAELGLGHTKAALDAIAKSEAIVKHTHDHTYGSSRMELNAGLYAQAGRADLAVPLLARALATPGIGELYSPTLLGLDPAWAPIRHDPGFQALLKKYRNDAPALSSHARPAPSSSTSSV